MQRGFLVTLSSLTTTERPACLTAVDHACTSDSFNTNLSDCFDLGDIVILPNDVALAGVDAAAAGFACVPRLAIISAAPKRIIRNTSVAFIVAPRSVSLSKPIQPNPRAVADERSVLADCRCLTLVLRTTE